MEFCSAVHGSNVVIEDNGRRATRRNEFSFCNGLVFSDKPIEINRPVTLVVKSSDIKWRGALSIGLISKSPTDLTKEKPLPRILHQLHGDSSLSFKTTSQSWGDCRLVLLLSSNNELVVTRNDDPPHIFLPKFTVLPDSSVHLMIDLFGRTTSIAFYEFNGKNVQIPTDIALLGPNAVGAFKTACREASVPVTQGRACVIGPHGTGKTSLIRALLGISSDEKCVSPLETSYVSLCTKSGEWTCSTTDDETKQHDHIELANIIAFNITREDQFKSDLFEPSTTCAVKTALGLTPSRRNEDYTPDVKGWIDSFPAALGDSVKSLLSDEGKKWFNDDTQSVRNQVKHKCNLWEFSGDSLYMLIHQVLLTPYAVYVLVVDISEHLEAPIATSYDHVIQAETRKNDVTTLSMIHYWLSIINSLVGQQSCLADFSVNSGKLPIENQADKKTDENDDNMPVLLPKILLVGTHRNSVHLEPITRDQIIEETIDKIEKSLEGKPYQGLVHPHVFTLDCNQMSHDEPSLINQLRAGIDQTLNEQHLINFDIPLTWLSFEFTLKKLIARNIYFVDIQRLFEVTSSQFDSLYTFEEFRPMLQFYHIQGKIYLLNRNTNEHTFADELVILQPVWFAHRLYELCDAVRMTLDNDDDGHVDSRYGMLNDDIVNKVWSKWLDHKLALLGCMERLDLACELRLYMGVDEPPDVAASALHHPSPRLYFFPWITQLLPETFGYESYAETYADASIQLAIDFKNLLPVGYFSRLVIRLSRWSWAQGWGRRPEVCHAEARIGVDFEHDLVLRLKLNTHKVDVIIMKIYEGIHNEDGNGNGPTSNVCVKVRHLIESELEFLRNNYYNRVNSTLVVPCPCQAQCKIHDAAACTQEGCEHYVSLDRCLNSRVVECDFRQVNTSFIQRYFPQAHFFNGYGGQNLDTFADSFTPGPMIDIGTGWEQVFRVEPQWMREAAKLLLMPNPGHDWLMLSKRLGYGDRDANRLVEETNPSLALLHDWYDSNGRTKYCIDVLLSCLRMIARDDVRSVIESNLEPEGSAPPIFISYQWDSQEAVLELRRKLELAGFPCWMDVGHMSTGDSLYGKIYDGISRAKVVLCCLSPRYAASRICAREITLADVLHKPILPIMIEPTPWPPPGPLAVVMSSLVYVDLCGVGGHGGIGRRGDSESRFRDILDRIARYIAGHLDAPVFNRQLFLPDVFATSDPGAIGGVDAGSSRTTRLVAIRSDHLLSARSAQRASSPQEETGRLEPSTSSASQEIRDVGLAFGPDDVMSEDSISVLSHVRSPHNRISNCSICVII